MNDSEIHLFILWERALEQKEKIIDEIKKKFTILKIYNIHWSETNFINNLSRFYGTSLPDCEAKANHCGKGDFYLIIVKDDNPIYDKRNTSKGIKYLNVNMFDCKEKFRNLTGGGHKVHATNDETEANHDMTLLLDKSLNDFKDEKIIEWNGNIERIDKDLFGYNGWKSISEMFYALNNCIKYAILRNYENLPDEIYLNKHNDIDLICDSVDNCAYILNAKKVYLQDYRVNYQAKVDGKIVNLDLRYIGDQYYCYELECNLIKNREYNPKGFFTLNKKDYFFTLLYHALIHKKIFKEDYKLRLIKMKTEIVKENLTNDSMIMILKKWLQDNRYTVTSPNDRSVDFNMENAIKFKPLLDLDYRYIEEFNVNILNWYNFNKNSKILFIGDSESIENYFKNMQVTFYKISRFSYEQKINNRYDYIIIYGIENYQKEILNLKPYLENDGKALIIGNNEFGIRNWCKYNCNENLGINQLNKNNFEKTTLKLIIEALKKYGINQVNKFYVFPNYKEPELILNEKAEINNSYLEKYNEDIRKKDVKINDETEVLKNIVMDSKENLDIFSNSFIVEASSYQIENDIRYVSFNNCRNEEYRLITIITDKIVKKLPANLISKNHIENIAKNISNLKAQNINILDYVKDGCLYSKLIKNKLTLDEKISRYSYNLDKVTEILERFKNILMKDSINFKECQENVKYKDVFNLEKLHFLKKAYWDMIPKNCFEIDEKYYFFDQEWVEEYLPVEFIIYRSIINCYDLVRKIDINILLKKLEIMEYKSYFEKLDKNLRKKIIDKSLYNKMHSKEITTIQSIIDNENIFKFDNKNKEEYIKYLGKEIADIKEDNKKKQEYIENLERINSELKDALNQKKSFFRRRK